MLFIHSDQCTKAQLCTDMMSSKGIERDLMLKLGRALS